MSLSTLAAYKTWASITGTDATRDASLESVLSGVIAAIRKRIRSNILAASKDLILDAPASDVLNLVKYAPVQASGFAIYRNLTARGQLSAFTSDTLQVLGTQYQLDIGPDGQSESRTGIVYRLGGWWGPAFEYPRNSLDVRVESARGALRVVFTCGASTVPDDIVLAVHLAASKVYAMREVGAQLSSESWNGYSKSISGQGSAVDVLSDPTISALLRPYGGNQLIIG